MKQFDAEIVAEMQAALVDVFRHVPPGATSTRTLIAGRILACASRGDVGREDLVNAGMRAVLDQFGSMGSPELLRLNASQKSGPKPRF